jgi:hypothetical protein
MMGFGTSEPHLSFHNNPSVRVLGVCHMGDIPGREGYALYHNWIGLLPSERMKSLILVSPDLT